MSPRPIQPFEEHVELRDYDALIAAERVRILPDTVELGPYGEFGEYRTFELPEYGTLDGFEAGGMVSVTPEGWDFDVWLDEEDIAPADVVVEGEIR